MEQKNASMRQEDDQENEINEAIPTEVEAEQENATVSMEDLLEEEGLELDFPKQGEIRTGIIATIGENEILVSVGTKSEGVISGRELESIPNEDREVFDVGQEIPVYVVTPEDTNGNVVLSYTRAREEHDWEEVGRMLENEEIIESKVIGYNKGGLIVPIGRLRGFVPTSQVSFLRRLETGGDTPEQRWGSMIDEPIQVRVIEVDRERRRLILSERAALQETRETLKDRLLDELEVGDVRKGRVTSLADFGAFVNIEGADGLVHLSEISWDRIKHPNEVLEIGQEVEVKVISIDRERKRIGLSLRQLQEDPWVKKVEHLREGMLIEGTITHLTKFGAFARLDEELEGLIHVSELSEQRIAHPKELLHEGDVVTLRVIKIDPERHRIGLSLRKVDSARYADLDWKMALAQEVGKAGETESEEETRSILFGEKESGDEEHIEAESADEVETTEEAEVAEDAEISTEADGIVDVDDSREDEVVEEDVAEDGEVEVADENDDSNASEIEQSDTDEQSLAEEEAESLEEHLAELQEETESEDS